MVASFEELRIETEMGHKQVFSMEGSDSHSLQMFSFDDIKAATNDFSNENKLGQGGYGPVYKVILFYLPLDVYKLEENSITVKATTN
mgnify:FL=1